MSYTTTPENKSNAYGRSNWPKLILIYIVIGAILYAGVYYFVLAKKGTSYNQTQTVPAAVVPETQNKVTLSSDGFTPQTLTIKVGDSVTWINNSGGAATVNSDPHPIHTNYPPLNLGRFNDGEMLTLKFDKPGTYGYHNHVNPNQTGKIIVE